MLFARRPIWTSRRARGASSPRLYVVRRIRKIPPFVAKQKVFGIPIPRAQKESASSLRSTRALRVDDGERSTQTRKQKKRRRCPTTIARAPLIFLSRCSSTPSRRRFRYLDLYTVVQKTGGGGVCVCVDIRKNISLCHSCLFLPTINRIIKGRLLKKNSWLSRVFRSKKSTHFDMENGRGLFHHQPTKKKARASCADFSFFTTESKNPKTKRHFFLDDGIFTSRHKKDKNPVVVPARS